MYAICMKVPGTCLAIDRCVLQTIEQEQFNIVAMVFNFCSFLALDIHSLTVDTTILPSICPVRGSRCFFYQCFL